MTTMMNARADHPVGDRAWLRRLTSELTRDAAAAEELFHDVTAIAAAAPHGDIGAPRPWLRSVARRQAARAHRDAKRRARREHAAARPEALPSALEEAERRELECHLRAAVRDLHEPYRTMIQLRFFDDCKPAAIARRIGVPVETVRVRVRRGLTMLRERLDAAFGQRTAWLALVARVDARAAATSVTGVGLAPWVAGVAMLGAVALAGVAVLRPETAPVGPEQVAAADRVAPIEADSDPSPPPPDFRRTAVTAADHASAAAPVRSESGPTTNAPMVVDSRRGTVVLGILERIATAQRALAADACIDADGDGVGEHGYLLELMGHVERPGARAPSRAVAMEAARLRVALGTAHPRSQSPITAGVAKSNDYAFQMFLPGAHGTPLAEAAQGGPAAPFPDPDRAERSWCCYAWPLTPRDGVPEPVFFVDQTGMVLAADNVRGAYAGVGRGPSPAAALRADTSGAVGDASAASDPHRRGWDGQVWQPAVRPPTATTSLEVVDHAGAPVPDVRVAIWTADDAALDELDVAAQQRALAGVTLAVGGHSRTDAKGRITITGPVLASPVVVVSVGRSHLVPTRVSVVERRLRVELPRITGARYERSHANESAAIATLKNISSAQAQCQAAGVIDANGNGAGEYGYFAELAGVAFVRGPDGPSDDKIAPPVLSSAFGNLHPASEGLRANIVVRSGYCYQMFLPGASGHAVPEAPTGGAGLVAPDPGSSEVIWCCYAWPTTFGESGQRAFFVNQNGDVFASGNEITRYSGVHRGPLPNAIFPPSGDGKLSQQLEAKATGTDGEEWSVVF